MSPPDTAASGVGASLPRLDAREKVTGRATYIADMVRPDMLHAAIHASPLAHARIRGYDTAEAQAVPGVACVLTGDDFPDGRMGAFIKDEPAIAKGKVRYPGEPVAVVAAEDEETARRAAALIRVDYEELPVAATPEAAVAPDAPLIHEDLADYFKVFPAICGGNVASETELSEGDVDGAWAECDVIVEGDFETPAQAHLSIEPVGALAEVDAEGRVTLWSANQSVFRVQANVCEALQLPMSKLRSLTPKVGAGFGNKMEPHVQPLVVQLALKTGRPVRLILNRTEDFETVRARHPFKIRCRTGARKDGTLVARELTAVLDCGAYGDDSPGVLGYSLLMSRGPYRIPHCRASGKLVYTNRMRFGAFRGFGNPQVTFATESQIDEIAGRLGMDPLDLRMKNRMQPGDRWFGGGEVASNGLAECIEKATRGVGLAAGQGARRARRQAARPGRRGLRPYQRPAGDRRHRAAARGRLGRAQHRRGRYRPGLRYRAHPDVRLGAQGSGRPGGDRQPGYRRLALQLGHDGEPRHLHDRALGRRRGGQGGGCRSSATRRRFSNAPSRIWSCATAAGSASRACRTRS